MAGKGPGIGKAALALFTILLISSVGILTVAMQEATPKVRGEAQVDSAGILQALLSSTVDEVTYIDAGGNVSVYTGWTIGALLVEDLELRLNQTVAANLTSMGSGIEGQVTEQLKGLSGLHHYNLKVSFTTTYFRITDVGITGGSQATATLPMKTVDGEAKVTLVMTE